MSDYRALVEKMLSEDPVLDEAFDVNGAFANRPKAKIVRDKEVERLQAIIDGLINGAETNSNQAQFEHGINMILDRAGWSAKQWRDFHKKLFGFESELKPVVSIGPIYKEILTRGRENIRDHGNLRGVGEGTAQSDISVRAIRKDVRKTLSGGGRPYQATDDSIGRPYRTQTK